MEKRKKKKGVKYCGISIPTVIISRFDRVNKKLLVPSNVPTSFPVPSFDSGDEVGNYPNLCI